MKTPILNIDQFQTSEPLQGLYVNTFSNHIKLNKELLAKAHSHDFYLCVMFTEGTGTHEIDFNSYAINPGNIFFLKPGQTHYWKFKSNPKGFIFFHSKEFYEFKYLDHRLHSFPFFTSYQNPPILELAQVKIKGYERKFQKIYMEYNQNKFFKELKIVSLINSIYIDLTREYTLNIDIVTLFPPNYLKILENLEILINKNFYTEKFPKFYSNQLNITTKHLNRVIKETIGKTTSQLISERIMLEAKRIIVHSNDNLSNIANMLGFSDYAYFSKVFKIKTGLTPINFRKKYINK